MNGVSNPADGSTGRGWPVFKASLTYFALVFGAGFALGTLRTLVFVPRLGERTAELLETPLMLLVVWAAARFVDARSGLPDAGARLRMGAVALLLLLLAECSVVVLVRRQGLGDYVASRDPLSGSVYLAALAWYALAPALVGRKARSPQGRENPE